MPFPQSTILLLVLALMLVLRVVGDRLDRRRIAADVATRGGVALDITWKPFGRGWFGEKSDRVYLVEWMDAARAPFAFGPKGFHSLEEPLFPGCRRLGGPCGRRGLRRGCRPGVSAR